MLLKAFKKNIFSYLDQNYQNWDITIAMRYQPVVDLIRLKYTPADKLLEIGPGELGILPYSLRFWRFRLLQAWPADRSYPRAQA
jgi:hypothetical protein